MNLKKWMEGMGLSKTKHTKTGVAAKESKTATFVSGTKIHSGFSPLKGRVVDSGYLKGSIIK